MGLNIILFNLSAVKDTTYPWHDVERDERFDSARYTGDKEFFAWLLIGEHGEFRTLGSDRDTEGYMRPKDIDIARAWIKANIAECNHQRWFDLFDLLEVDEEKHLWLQGMW